MKRLVFVLVPVLLFAMVAAVAVQRNTSAQEDTFLKVVNDPALGAILTDANGMTLYLFTPDTVAGSSNCYDKCAENWPILQPSDNMTLPKGVPGTLGVIDRTDGIQQVTYNDIPLYYWVKDTAAGETTGQNVGGVWFVVPPGARLGTYPPAPGEGTPVPAATFHIGFTEELGPFLTDAAGMTLYLFTTDTVPGESTCYDKCAENWPIVQPMDGMMLPHGVQGTLGVIERTDGIQQVTYNDIPLYYWVKDAAPGDTTGQGVGDVWYIIPPDAKLGDPPRLAETGATPEA